MNQRQYYIANGSDDLKLVLSDLARVAQAKVATATKNTQYDIVFLLGNLTALLKVDFGRAQPKFWFSDFQNGRPAPLPIKNAIVEFIKRTQVDHAVNDADILSTHLRDYSLEKMYEKNRDFLTSSNARMIIDADDVAATNESDVQVSVKATVSQQNVVSLDPKLISKLVSAQAELDMIASPTNDYKQVGRYPSLFNKDVARKELKNNDVDVPKPSHPFGKNG